MSSTPRIRYICRPDTTLETERDALAAVIRFVLDCHAKKEGGPTITAPDDPKKECERRRLCETKM
jgi:hypothetical protein